MTAENLSVQRLILPSVQAPEGCRTDGGKPSILTSDPQQEAGASSELIQTGTDGCSTSYIDTHDHRLITQSPLT